jgi:Tol biopolymer transport system component
VLGAGVLALSGRMPSTAEDRVPAFALRRLTELPGPELQPDISADGRQILYASAVTGNLDIYLLRVGGAHAINLTVNSPADDSAARFSPEGDQIVFRSERDSGGLFLMGATGESVRRLTTAGFDPAWSPDGRSVAYSMEAVDDPYSRRLQVPLWVVDIATGKTERLVAGDGVQPAWSPNGRRIAYWANTTGGQRDIWTVPASGGEPIAVTNDAATDWSPTWSPDGHWLYFSSDRGGAMNLWRVRIDPESGARQGNLDPVTTGVRGLSYARFASDGRSLTVMGYDRTSDLALAAFDPAHPDRITPRIAFRHQALISCDPSPDGSWLACGSSGAREDLVLLRADGTETRRLMDDLHKDRRPLWSPDGKSLAFISTRSGLWETWRVQVDGSDLRAMTQFAADASTGVWAPDGRRMLVAAIQAGITWTFDTSQVGTRSNATVVKGAPKGFENPIWSPSGELVAGDAVTPAGTYVVGVLTLATGAWTASTAPLASRSQPVGWLPDSRHFLIQAPDGLVLVKAATGEWRRLLPGSMSDRYRLSRDGRTLVIERDVFDSDVWLMRVEPPAAAGR